MQGPRRKWRPRIVLLTAVLGIAAASHIAALPVAALLGLVFMLWVAEGRRSQILPVMLARIGWAHCCLSFPATTSRRTHSATFSAPRQLFCGFRSTRRARFFSTSGECRHHCRCRFGRCALSGRLAARATSAIRRHCSPRLSLVPLVMTGVPGTPWLWALPFLLTFVGGVFADAYESPRGQTCHCSRRGDRCSAGGFLSSESAGPDLNAP